MNYLFTSQRLGFRFMDPIRDAESFYNLNHDPEVLKYTGDLPFITVAEAEKFIRSYTKSINKPA